METNKDIKNKDDVCKYLQIPSIPKKAWDGKTDFKTGVAVLKLYDNSYAYAVASYDSTRDNIPRILKVFTPEQFVGYAGFYIVPDYMETDVDNMDLDDESKEMARGLVEQAKNIDVDEKDFERPKNEYFFDNIHNDEEAIAFIKAYSKGDKKKKGRIPKTHEGIIMRLSVMYADMNKETK